jgi:hypothetical protein
VLFELVAGLDSELAERFAWVVVDGVGPDEQLGGDLLVRGPLGREATPVRFLGGQVIARVGRLRRSDASRPAASPLTQFFAAELRAFARPARARLPRKSDAAATAVGCPPATPKAVQRLRVLGFDQTDTLPVAHLGVERSAGV